MSGPSGVLQFALLLLIATVGPPGVYSQESVVHTEASEESILPWSIMKAKPRGANPNPSIETYDTDKDFVYAKFKQIFRRWQQGAAVIDNISELLHLEPKAITHKRVEFNEVTFRINKNLQNLNATELAKRIGMIKGLLQITTGMNVVAVGVGDRERMQSEFLPKIDEPVNSAENGSFSIMDVNVNGTMKKLN